MENLLDLKMPGVMELGRKELTNVDGGGPFIWLVVITARVEFELAKEFIEGFGEGWKKNKI